MNRPLSLILALGVGVALSGCGNTLNGAKQDATNDTQKAQQATADAERKTQQAAADAAQTTKDAAAKTGQAIEKAPQNAEANTVVRPAVKTAIIRDPVLAQSSNLIDVNAGPKEITLSGHVADASMKQRATEDAQVVLKKHPGYTLTNNLAVGGGQ